MLKRAVAAVAVVVGWARLRQRLLAYGRALR